MRIAPALFLTLLIAGCGETRPPVPARASEGAPPAVAPALVLIEAHKKDGEKDTYTYGWVEPATLERLIAGADLPKFIRIHDAYWFNDSGATMLEDEDNSGVYYLRIDTLRDVTELRPRSVDSIRAKEKDADAKRAAAKKAKADAKAAGNAKDVLP